MSPAIATAICAIGILGLYLLDRDPTVHTSKALWIPLFWLLISGSRSVGEWVQLGAPFDGTDNTIEGNPIERNVLAGIIALGVIVLIRRRKRVAKILNANWPVLLYIAYCLVSIFWSDYPFVVFKRWIRFSGDLVMVLVILTDRDWLAARKKILAWPAFVLLPLSILFIKYYPELGRMYGRWDYVMSWTGVTSQKNQLGAISMVLGLASAWRFLDACRERQVPNRLRVLIAQGTILAMAIYLLLMAKSATSLACFVLGCVVLVLTSWRSVARIPGLVHFLIGTLLFASFSALFLIPGSGLVEALGRNSTLTGRTDIWSLALSLVKNPVLGAGYENFWLGSRLTQMQALDPGLKQAHNGYLEVYLNLGWVGVTLLAVVIMTGYRNIISAFHRDPNTARLGLVYFVVALSYNFTEAAFNMMNVIWILFLLSTIALPAVAGEESPVLLPAPLFRAKTFAKAKPQVADSLVARFPKRTI